MGVCKPLPEAFWLKVAICGQEECWEWRGARNRKGYGNFRNRSAHVVSYELAHGPVGVDLTIDHLCKNRSCVNPNHLEAVTLQENIRRHAASITHCKHGHPLSGSNVKLVFRADGTRRKCRACTENSRRASRARRKALTAIKGGDHD